MQEPMWICEYGLIPMKCLPSRNFVWNSAWTNVISTKRQRTTRLFSQTKCSASWWLSSSDLVLAFQQARTPWYCWIWEHEDLIGTVLEQPNRRRYGVGVTWSIWLNTCISSSEQRMASVICAPHKSGDYLPNSLLIQRMASRPKDHKCGTSTFRLIHCEKVLCTFIWLA
jgi:hypothetical protein